MDVKLIIVNGGFCQYLPVYRQISPRAKLFRRCPPVLLYGFAGRLSSGVYFSIRKMDSTLV